MKIFSTIIVLIVAAAGVMAMVRVGWDPSVGRTNTMQSSRLSPAAPLPIDDVTRITLNRADEQPLIFERADNGQWNQIAPFAYPMELFAIRQLILQARELEVTDVIEPTELQGGLSLSTLSLHPPLAEITYEWPGQSLTLHLGRRSVAGGAYLQVAGDDRIYLVNHALHERALEMNSSEWRDRTIFPNAGVESERIEWRNGPARLTLARDRKQWKMIEPAQTRLDAGFRDQYLDAIGRAVVSGFILDQPSDTDLAKFGLIDSPLSLTITAPQDGGTQRLIIGSRAGGGTMDYFGMIEGRPAVVRISGAVLAALFRLPENLAAQTGSGVNPADVKSIIIRAKDSELTLQRELEKWQAVVPAPQPASADDAAATTREVNAAHVQQLLEQLTQLRATSVEFAAYPRQLEVAVITLYGYNAKAIDTVRIIHDNETGKWAMENGDNVLRVFPPSLKLRLTAADFELE